MASLLVTGFPGFIGTRLVRRLLADAPDATVVALVEPRMAERAREVAATLQGGDRVTVQPGDIADPLLGVDDATYERLAAEIDRDPPPRRDLRPRGARRHRRARQRRRHAARARPRAPRASGSSATTTSRPPTSRAGARAASTRPSWPPARRSRTTTSRRSSPPRSSCATRSTSVPTTIYRPAIVVGDSRTGETQKFDGPYYLLRTISRLHGRPLPQIGTRRRAVQRRAGRLRRRRDRGRRAATRRSSGARCTSSTPNRCPRPS